MKIEDFNLKLNKIILSNDTTNLKDLLISLKDDPNKEDFTIKIFDFFKLNQALISNDNHTLYVEFIRNNNLDYISDEDTYMSESPLYFNKFIFSKGDIKTKYNLIYRIINNLDSNKEEKKNTLTNLKLHVTNDEYEFYLNYQSMIIDVLIDEEEKYIEILKNILVVNPLNIEAQIFLVFLAKKFGYDIYVDCLQLEFNYIDKDYTIDLLVDEYKYSFLYNQGSILGPTYYYLNREEDAINVYINGVLTCGLDGYSKSFIKNNLQDSCLPRQVKASSRLNWFIFIFFIVLIYLAYLLISTIVRSVF